MFWNRRTQKKLFIPKVDKFYGGPKTFLTNLSKYLHEKGVKTISDPLNSDLIFFPVEFPKEILEKASKKKIPIVQRLDGVFYEPEHNKAQLEFDNYVKEIYLKYANYVIFQSEYSKSQCFFKYGEKSPDQFSLIVNGVDKTIFYPSDSEHDPTNFIRFVTTGNIRRKEMIEPIVLALDELRTEFNFELTVVGKITDELKPYLNRDYLNYVGPKELQEVSKILRNSDIFLFSFLNPACPNSVIEAVSTGLPVVSFDSGSMKELVGFNKDLLAFVSDDLFQNVKDFKYEKLKEKIKLCVDNFRKYKKESYLQSSLYSFETCGDQYMETFNAIINQKPK